MIPPKYADIIGDERYKAAPYDKRISVTNDYWDAYEKETGDVEYAKGQRELALRRIDLKDEIERADPVQSRVLSAEADEVSFALGATEAIKRGELDQAGFQKALASHEERRAQNKARLDEIKPFFEQSKRKSEVRTAMAGEFEKSGLFGSVTAAAGGAADKEIRLLPNGDWDIPELYKTTGNPVMDSVGGALTNLSQKAGARMQNTGALDSQIETQDVFKKIQESTGASEEEMKAAWMDIGNIYRKMEKGEKARVLSDGTIVPNYNDSDWLNPEKAAKIIDSLPAPEISKELLKYKLKGIGGIAQNIAHSKLEAYTTAAILNPLESPVDWAKKKGRVDDYGTPKFVEDYEKEVANQQGVGGKLLADYAQGGMKLISTGAGAAALASSYASEGLEFTGFDDGSRRADMLTSFAGKVGAEVSKTSQLSNQGIGDTPFYVGKVIEELPSLLAQALITRGIGAGATAAGFSKAAVGRIGMAGMLTTAGMQSAGMTYSQEIAGGASEKVARSKATKAGLNTAIITGFFNKIGFGGAESAMLNKGAAGVAMRDIFAAKSKAELAKAMGRSGGSIAKGIIGEGLEEGWDEFTAAFLNADPDTNLADAWANAVEAAKIGAILGGGMATISSIAETPTHLKGLNELERQANATSKSTAQENLPEAETAGRAFPTSGPVSLAEIERERAAQIELTEDPEEKKTLAEATPEELAGEWGVELKLISNRGLEIAASKRRSDLLRKKEGREPMPGEAVNFSDRPQELTEQEQAELDFLEENAGDNMDHKAVADRYGFELKPVKVVGEKAKVEDTTPPVGVAPAAAPTAPKAKTPRYTPLPTREERVKLENEVETKLEGEFDTETRKRKLSQFQKLRKDHLDARRERDVAQDNNDARGARTAEIEMSEIEDRMRELAGLEKVHEGAPITEEEQTKQREFFAKRAVEVQAKLDAGEELTKSDRMDWEAAGKDPKLLPQKESQEPGAAKTEGVSGEAKSPVAPASESLPKPTVEKVEDFNNPDAAYRIIRGDEAFQDIVDSGVVRTDYKNKAKADLSTPGQIDLGGRPTRSPSFSKGAPSAEYAKGEDNHYIVESTDPSITPSTQGRHGKGSTHFPHDAQGKSLDSLDGSKVNVYKHVGNGKYELVYSKGKLVTAPAAAPTTTPALAESKGAPQAKAVVSKLLTPESKALPPAYFEQDKKASPEQVALQNKVAKMYDALPEDDSSNPEVVQAYKNLVKEVMLQHKAMTDSGLKIEIVKGNPYASSEEMVADVKRGVLKIQATEPSSYGNNPDTFKDSNHPMLDDSGVTDANGKPLLVNDVFRAVHDYIAHAAFGSSFGALGEEAAWKAHMATITDPLARRALTTETRGQNSWVNYRDEMLRDGKPIKKGEPGYVAPQDRPFATQKFALLPEEALQEVTPTTNETKIEKTGRPAPEQKQPAQPAAEGQAQKGAAQREGEGQEVGTKPIKLSGFKGSTQSTNRDLIIESLGEPTETGVVETDSGVKVEMYPFEDGVELRAIQNLTGTKGAASETLDRITEEADTLGTKLYLYPKPFGTGERMSKAQLVAWYERKGFVMSKDGETMVRTPKAAKPAQQPKPKAVTTDKTEDIDVASEETVRAVNDAVLEALGLTAEEAQEITGENLTKPKPVSEENPTGPKMDKNGQLELFQEPEPEAPENPAVGRFLRENKEPDESTSGLLEDAGEVLFNDTRQSNLSRTGQRVAKLADNLIQNNINKSGNVAVGLVNMYGFLAKVWSMKNRRTPGWPSFLTPKQVANRASILAHEIVSSIAKKGSGVDWYRGKIDEMYVTLSRFYPELREAGQDRFIFSTILAITSNGENVFNNMNLAVKLYDIVRGQGRMPNENDASGIAAREKAMFKGFATVQRLIEKDGWATVDADFKTETPYGAMKKKYGVAKNDEAADVEVSNAYVLGAKIGAFWGNLNGNFKHIAMDLWFTRTMSRIAGDFSTIDPSKLKKYAKILAVADDVPSEVRDELQMFLNDIPQEGANWTSVPVEIRDKMPLAYAWIKQSFNRYASRKDPETGKTYYQGTYTEIQSKYFITALDKNTNAPKNADHRQWMRDVLNEAQRQLKEAGIDLSLAEIQAVMWFHEKDLYTKFGATSKMGERADYAQAAENSMAGRTQFRGDAGPRAADVAQDLFGREVDAAASREAKKKSNVKLAAQIKELREKKGVTTLNQDKDPKGQVTFRGLSEAFITYMKSADGSTAVHEPIHVARRFLLNRNVPTDKRLGITDDMIDAANEFVGAKDSNWTVEQEEKFARAFERYLWEGAETGNAKVDTVFSKIRDLLRKVYSAIEGSSLDVELTPEIKKLFGQLITRGETLKEQGVKPTAIPLKVEVKGKTAKPEAKPQPAPKRKIPARKIPAPLPFGVKREDLDAARRRYGIPERQGMVVRMTDEESLDEAYARLAKRDKGDESALVGQELVLDLMEDNRGTNKVEVALLAIHGFEIQKALKDLENKIAKLNPAETQKRKSYETLQEALLADFQDLVNITQLQGSRAGLALQAMKLVANEVYSVDAMLRRRAIWKNTGKKQGQAKEPLTPAEMRDTEAQSKKILELIKERERLMKELEDKYNREEAAAILDKKFKDVAKEKKPAKPRGVLVEKATAIATSARDRLRAMGLGVTRLNQMAGERAQMPQFQRDSLETAKAMAAAGKTPEEIRAVTGWFPGKYDGKMRWEIPDAGAKLTTKWENLPASNAFGKKEFILLKDALDHPELFKAYPQLGDVWLSKESGFFDFFGAVQGWFNPDNGSLNITPNATDPLSTLLHETQHWIQQREGFAKGANTESSMKSLTPQQKEKVAEKMRVKASDLIEKTEKELSAISNLISKLSEVDREKFNYLTAVAEESREAFRQAVKEYGASDAKTIKALNDETKAENDILIFVGIDPMKQLSVWDLAYPLKNAKSFEDLQTKSLEKRHKLRTTILNHNTLLTNMTNSDEDFEAAVKDFGLAYELYTRVAGEIEARDVQARANMTSEQLAATAPYSSENIAEDDAIVLFQEGEGKTKRNPIVTQAAQDFKAGKISREEYNIIVDANMPLAKFGKILTPATPEDVLRGLGNRKAGARLKSDLVVKPEDIPAGKALAARLDIPAYESENVWVVTLHLPGKGGEVFGFTPTAVLNNVTFDVNENAALGVATGKPKSSFARMDGSYVPMTSKEAQALAEKALKEGWVEIGMNPIRHSYFYDKSNQNPVVSAEQVVQIGALVLAKNPKFGEKSETLFQDSESTQVEILDALSDVGTEYLAGNAKTIEAFTEKLVSEFGEEFRDQAETVFGLAKDKLAKLASTARQKTPQELSSLIDPTKGISEKMVYNMALGFMRQGLKGEAVLDAVTKLLQNDYPNLTREEVVVAFTGYGRIKIPSQEQIRKDLRELRTIERLDAQLADLARGQLPKRTGLQRDKTTPTVRSKMKQVEQAIRDSGLQHNDKKDRLAGSLDPIRTRLKNEIADMDQAIKTKTALNKAKKEPKTDAEIEKLKKERDAMKKRYDATFGIDRKKISVEAQIKRASAMLDRQIKALEAEARGEILNNPKKVKLDSPELKAKRERLESLREAKRIAQEARNPKKTAAEIATNRLYDSVNKSIERFEYFIRNGTYPPTAKGVAPTLNSVLKDMMATRDRLRDTVREIQKDRRILTPPEVIARRRAIVQLNKTIADLNARIAKRDFSKRAKKPESTDPAVRNLKATVASLRATLDQLKKDALKPVSPEEKRIQRMIAASKKRRENYERRLAAGDFAKTVKRDTKEDSRLTQTKIDEAKAKNEWMEKAREYAVANMNSLQKVKYTIKNILIIRKLTTLGAEFGIAFRQLLFFTYRGFFNPKAVTKTFIKAFNATFSRDKEIEYYNNFIDRPYSTYDKRMGLKLISPFADIDRLQEMDAVDPEILEKINSKIPKWIPLRWATEFLLSVERFNRVSTNAARVYFADNMLDKGIRDPGNPTEEELKIIGNATMVFTGRGSLGKGDLEKGVAAMNMVTISARYAVSRAQVVLLQPLWTTSGDFKGTVKLRAHIASDIYGKAIIGRVLAGTLIYQIAKALIPDDEEEEMVWDPTSSKFGVIYYKGTAIELNGGARPYINLLAQAVMGYKLNSKGEVVPLRGEGSIGFGKQDFRDTLYDFVRNRENVNMAMILDTITQKHFGDIPMTKTSFTRQFLEPIIVDDLVRIFETHGIRDGSVLATALFFGVGVRTPWEKTEKKEPEYNWIRF